MLHTITEGITDINDIIETIIKSHVDGVIVYNDKLSMPEMDKLSKYNIPIVIIGNRVKGDHVFLAGALTSSAGIFLAKTLSFLYVIPFSALAGTENITIYAAAYSWYTALLQIALAGIPFAAAALAAGYAEKNDIRTVLLIRKLTTSILTVSGFVMKTGWSGYRFTVASAI